jgi:hypothetical protein
MDEDGLGFGASKSALQLDEHVMGIDAGWRVRAYEM